MYPDKKVLKERKSLLLKTREGLFENQRMVNRKIADIEEELEIINGLLSLHNKES